jgi:RNA polymerase sigma-70 factor, ECF subfamily
VDAGSDNHPEQAAPSACGHPPASDAGPHGTAPDGPIAATAAFLESFETLKRIAAGLGLGPADVQDTLQDVYVQASRRDMALPPKEARAWLVRVTVNRALLEHRQRKRFRQAATRMVQERPHREVPSPDALAEKDEQLTAVRQAMEQLDEGLLTVTVLRYFTGMDSTQIGQALGIPPATVRRRLHDARLILAKRLIEGGFGL